MTQDPKLRALSVFDDYLDLSGAAQARMRADLQQRDPELLAALLSLLAADGEASLLDIAPAELLAQVRSAEPAALETDDPRVGTRLGAWQIDGVIAEGGMGTVYAAHRADGQYEQRAALKCVRATLASPALLQAFVGERNHLARLEHPGIATLLDGGLDADGHPWFAMRYVDGVAVDAWCDRRNASVGERVDLLIQVCEALSYAHAQGIVHRDIKPSNVLVGADGRAHLVDFGISSHFGDAQAPGEHIAITPDYAAPEAREHGVHAPAADQYALGVLTYRLLCAQWPLPLHRLRNLIAVNISQPVPMDRLIDDDGAQALAHQRGARDAAALRRELAGDLSAIALKAVASLPQDRYASVSEFAQDLRRWREHRPLAIRPGSRWSRMRKWRRRNPAAALLTGVLVLAVLAGLSLSLWQQHRARREAAATETVSKLFATTLGTATLSGLGSTPFSSRTLLEKTERELRALPLDDQPKLLARGLATLARSYAVVGDYRYAERLTAQAQSLLEEARENEDFVHATHVALLNIQAHYPQAEALASKEIEKLRGRDDEPSRLSRLALGVEIARAQWGKGEAQKAVGTADELLRQARALGPEHRDMVAQILILRAGFTQKLLRLTEAESDLRQARALVHPLNPVLADDALEQLVAILAIRIDKDVLPYAEELTRNRRNTFGPSHPLTAKARIRLVMARYPYRSVEETSSAMSALQASYGRDHPSYASTLSATAKLMARNPGEQIAMMREALATLRRTVAPQSELISAAKSNLGKDLLALPGRLRTVQDVAEGTRLLREVVVEKHRRGAPAPVEQMHLINNALGFAEARQLADTQALLEQSRLETRRYFQPSDAVSRDLDHMADRLLYRQGQRARADRNFAARLQANREFMRTAVAGRSGNEYRLSVILGQSLIYRALYAFEQCRKDEARAYLRQAVDFDRRALGIDDPATATAQSFLDNLFERGQMHDDTDGRMLYPDDLDRLNRQARDCGR